MSNSELSDIPLPDGVRARYIDNHDGLKMHVLEAGFQPSGKPVLVLLHGFPELAYSWRKIMPTLAAAGYHIIAPDLRGFGRTTGWDGRFDGDVASFGTYNMARDVLGLVLAMGHRTVAAVIGHDFGSMIASCCALIRPDVFRSVVLMSLPFEGPPTLPFDVKEAPPAVGRTSSAIHGQLAALARPRKEYMRYFTTREANDDMLHCNQGVHNFLRAYYHVKSADWRQNRPYQLTSSKAEDLANLPRYYIMDLNETMATTVASEMPTADQIAACDWLSESELRVYSSEYERTGFQGGLNWFRCHTGVVGRNELELFSGRTIDVPSCFIAGQSDWGVYRKPGSIQKMRQQACTRMNDFHLIDGAGHWVQQEKSERVSELILEFLNAPIGTSAITNQVTPSLT